MPTSKSELASIAEDLELLPETLRLQAEMLVGKGCTLRRIDGGVEVVSESGAVIVDYAANCQRDDKSPPPVDWEGEDVPLIMTKKRQASVCLFLLMGLKRLDICFVGLQVSATEIDYDDVTASLNQRGPAEFAQEFSEALVEGQAIYKACKAAVVLQLGETRKRLETDRDLKLALAE